MAAKAPLRYEPVVFDGHQALAISKGFKVAIQRSGFVFHACSILPEHVHLVVARHRLMHREVMHQLKGEATKALERERLHPFEGVLLPGGRKHSPWTERGWHVFLDSPSDVHRAIRYVNDNPEKEGCPRQDWSFVQPFRRDA